MGGRGVHDGIWRSGNGLFPILNSQFSILIFSLLILFSCGEPAPQIPANKILESSLSEDLMFLNRDFAEFENEEIEHYVDSLNLGMLQTSSCLRYKIIREGYGRFPKKGDKVTFNYSMRALDGVECEELKNVTKTVELGKGNITSGMEEAIMLMKASGEGCFIIPSHLAYGVLGYKNCISGWTPVFCEINLISVKSPADD